MLRHLPGRLVAAVVGLTLLAGCTDGSAPPDASITLDEAAPDPVPAPDADPGPGRDGAPVPDDDPDDALTTCAEDTRRSLVATVDGQLTAIADRAWDRALTFASPGFREGIDESAFEDIITGSFPVVAAYEARDIGVCTVAEDGDEASLVVTVEDGDGTRQPLLYLFERDQDAWGISGALPGDDVGSDEPALTV